MEPGFDDIETGSKPSTIQHDKRNESDSADELDVDFDEIFTNKLKIKKK